MSDEITFQIEQLNFYYGNTQALRDVTMTVLPREITALIGPSGCGKSTFIRCINRMNDVIENCKVEGSIFFDKTNIYESTIDIVKLRSSIGMVFQKPNPFPKSIYDNIVYAPKLHGLVNSKTEEEELVEKSLKEAGLFDEVKDRLQESGTSLSGGQQQRLCIARAIAVNPSVILGPGDWNKGSSQIFQKIYNGLNFYTNGSTGYVDVVDVANSAIQLLESGIKNERFIIS